MRVLHVNTSATAGGAAIAAQRIIEAERGYGIEAQLLTRSGDDGSKRGKWGFIMERFGVWLREGFRKQNLWAIDPATHGIDITRLPEFKEADIIHLHWINQGMLSLNGLKHLRLTGKPIVWTMHDMWPFTGVCHHADNCTAYSDGSGCSTCHLNASLAASTYRRKAEVFGMEGSRICFVGCSKWLAGLAGKAPLLKGHSITAIPNPIDTNFFRPAENEEPTLLCKIPERPRILFVAYKAHDPNKGLQYLLEATQEMDVDVVIVGRHKAKHTMQKPMERTMQKPAAEYPREGMQLPDRKGKLYYMGLIKDRNQIRELYQTCDVLAMPTLKDNLPNTIVEAMACGMPCVGFRIGGLPEMIDHLENGYLSDYCSSEDLGKGLRTVLTGNRHAYQAAARLKAVQNYSESAVAARYHALYEEALKIES